MNFGANLELCNEETYLPENYITTNLVEKAMQLKNSVPALDALTKSQPSRQWKTMMKNLREKTLTTTIVGTKQALSSTCQLKVDLAQMFAN